MKHIGVESEMLSVAEAAVLLGLKEPTIRVWIAQRRLPHCKLGRAVRIPRQAVEALIAANMVPAVETRGR